MVLPWVCVAGMDCVRHGNVWKEYVGAGVEGVHKLGGHM